MDDAFSLILQLVTTRLGLVPREQDHGKIRAVLDSRRQRLNVTTLDAYYSFLQRFGERSDDEWRGLMQQLTNQESYFFRDRGQMTLLRETILPELIRHSGPSRCLRVWSAGSSTGEEAYSVAIMLHQALQGRMSNVSIIGTDISSSALDKARAGVYKEWSFRTCDPVLKERYFQRCGDGWKVDPAVAGSVVFLFGNLASDAYPDPDLGLECVDLIICRNVFIYFERSVVASAVAKFARTLRPGGYLMAGHAELQNVELLGLQRCSHQQALIYRKPASSDVGRVTLPVPPPARSLAPAVPTPVAAPPRPAVPAVQQSTTNERLEQALVLLQGNKCPAALPILADVLRAEPENLAALRAAAKCAANAGDYTAAAGYCRHALRLDDFQHEMYYLMAHMALEQGDEAQARALLKKVVYLAPEFTPAYLELALMYEQEGDRARASKMRESAAALLRALPAGSRYSADTDLTAGAMLAQLQRQGRS